MGLKVNPDCSQEPDNEFTDIFTNKRKNDVEQHKRKKYIVLQIVHKFVTKSTKLVEE